MRPHLDKLGWFAKIQQVALIGTPDFLGCIRHWFIAIELKATAKDKLRPMQDYNLKRIREVGGIGLVVHGENWKEAVALLQRLKEDDGAEGDLRKFA